MDLMAQRPMSKSRENNKGLILLLSFLIVIDYSVCWTIIDTDILGNDFWLFEHSKHTGKGLVWFFAGIGSLFGLLVAQSILQILLVFSWRTLDIIKPIIGGMMLVAASGVIMMCYMPVIWYMQSHSACSPYVNFASTAGFLFAVGIVVTAMVPPIARIYNTAPWVFMVWLPLCLMMMRGCANFGHALTTIRFPGDGGNSHEIMEMQDREVSSYYY